MNCGQARRGGSLVTLIFASPWSLIYAILNHLICLLSEPLP